MFTFNPNMVQDDEDEGEDVVTVAARESDEEV